MSAKSKYNKECDPDPLKATRTSSSYSSTPSSRYPEARPRGPDSHLFAAILLNQCLLDRGPIHLFLG